MMSKLLVAMGDSNRSSEADRQVVLRQQESDLRQQEFDRLCKGYSMAKSARDGKLTDLKYEVELAKEELTEARDNGADEDSLAAAQEKVHRARTNAREHMALPPLVEPIFPVLTVRSSSDASATSSGASSATVTIPDTVITATTRSLPGAEKGKKPVHVVVVPVPAIASASAAAIPAVAKSTTLPTMDEWNSMDASRQLALFRTLSPTLGPLVTLANMPVAIGAYAALKAISGLTPAPTAGGSTLPLPPLPSSTSTLPPLPTDTCATGCPGRKKCDLCRKRFTA